MSFTDGQAEARRLLIAGGVTAWIGSRRPNPLPQTWARVFRTGGSALSIKHESVQLGLEAYALDADGNPDGPGALALLNSMRAVLLFIDFPGQPGSPSTLMRPKEYGGVIDLPDPDGPHARYTTAIEFRARF